MAETTGENNAAHSLHINGAALLASTLIPKLNQFRSSEWRNEVKAADTRGSLTIDGKDMPDGKITGSEFPAFFDSIFPEKGPGSKKELCAMNNPDFSKTLVNAANRMKAIQMIAKHDASPLDENEMMRFRRLVDVKDILAKNIPDSKMAQASMTADFMDLWRVNPSKAEAANGEFAAKTVEALPTAIADYFKRHPNAKENAAALPDSDLSTLVRSNVRRSLCEEHQK